MNITRKAQLSLLENPSLAHSRHFGLCCWKILAPGMPKCLTQILLIPAQRIPASGDSRAIETSAARDPSPGRGAVLSLPRGSCCSLPQLDPYGAEFPSCSGSTTLAGAAAAALGGTKCWCRRAGGMAGGGQPAVGSSFLALVFVGGLAPALCGQRTPCLQHRAAGQTPQPVQQQLEPPGCSQAPPDSQKFTPVNQEEQEAELC